MLDLKSFLRRNRSSRGWLALPDRSQPDVAVKPEPYLAIYEELLTPLRRSSFALLELGVWKGDSLEMWRDAFPRATIVGVDLRPPPIDLGPTVHVIEGDQSDATLMARARAEYAPNGFEVIIDDASHVGALSASSVRALYMDHLRAGGIYVIEDWGTGYLPDWVDGGLLDRPLDIAGLADSERRPDGELLVSHQAGMVGLIKRLVDHVAAGTVGYGQPERLRKALPIEKLEIWDGLVVLRKPGPSARRDR